MTKTLTILALAAALTGASPALACRLHASHDNTPRAAEIHGLPFNNPGHGGSSANPNGQGANGGAGIHGIGNVPGQNADNGPRNGEPGFRDQLGTVHGGIGGGHGH